MGSGNKELFMPSSKGLRGPVDDNKKNGVIVNPPRYAEMSGRPGKHSPFKGDVVENTFKIRPPKG